MIQIDHEDIRIGDTIRTTYQMGDMLITSEGVVAGFSGAPRTKGGFYFDTAGDGVVIHLLNRPKKELPPVGTWVRVKSKGSTDYQIGQVQEDYGRLAKHVLTLANVIYDNENVIEDFEVIEWVAVDAD